MIATSELTALIVRAIKDIFYAINKHNKKDAAENVADNLSNGGDVLHSDKTITDLAGEPESDKPS